MRLPPVVCAAAHHRGSPGRSSTRYRRNVVQTRYQIVVGTSATGLLDGQELVWDSGAIESDRSVDIEYAGPALRSRTRYHWTVRSWIGDDVTAWADPAWWEMGLLPESDWSAHWIEPEQPRVVPVWELLGANHGARSTDRAPGFRPWRFVA
jgi:hypothetical protein